MSRTQANRDAGRCSWRGPPVDSERVETHGGVGSRRPCPKDRAVRNVVMETREDSVSEQPEADSTNVISIDDFTKVKLRVGRVVERYCPVIST